MLIRRQSGGLVIAFSMGLFSVGCFTNKSKEVAETAPPPPPSAYPSSPSSNPNSATGSGSSAPSPAMASAPKPSPVAPDPFQLREGEQLVPHVIASGESLSSIAGKYNSSIGRIMSANGMTDSKIFAGKTLQVPTSAPPANLAMNAASSSAPAPPVGGASSTGAPGVITSPGGAYPSATAPQVPTVPPAPVNPAATSFPREGAIVPPAQPGVTTTVPSFQGSRIQFGN